jgi:hypothetical protein
MSSQQAPARLRRAKASSDSFAGLIAGSFIIAALAEEWRVAVLSASQSEKGETGHFGGEDAFTFGRDGHHSGSAPDDVSALVADGEPRPFWDGVAEATVAPEFAALATEVSAAATADRDDASGLVAHHHAGWLITHA